MVVSDELRVQKRDDECDMHSYLCKKEIELFPLIKPCDLSSILGLEKTVAEYCMALILRYFSFMGIDIEKGSSVSVEDCEEQLRIHPKFRKMFSFFLSTLAEQKMIESSDGQIIFLQSIEDYPVDALLNKIRLLYPKFHMFFAFLEGCARAYPQVLSGEKLGVEVLFPPSDPMILKRLYETTPKIGYEYLYLYLAKEFLLQYTPQRGRLIEIGAGQGILTQLLLPELHSLLTNYTFTDIGESFLKDAKTRFGSVYPQMEFSLLDITKDPLQQNFLAESFDVLIGFNVIHATPDIVATLAQVKKLVKKTGIMCFIESARSEYWIDMIYGLTEGWWYFDDSIRTTSPLLSVDMWERCLHENGFTSFAVLPCDPVFRERTDTALILLDNKGET